MSLVFGFVPFVLLRTKKDHRSQFGVGKCCSILAGWKWHVLNAEAVTVEDYLLDSGMQIPGVQVLVDLVH